MGGGRVRVDDGGRGKWTCGDVIWRVCVHQGEKDEVVGVVRRELNF